MKLIRAFPIFGVDDLEVAVAFYGDILGFAVVWQWGSPPSRVGVACGDVELQLLGDRRLRPSAPGQVYIHMTGIETYYREACGRGAHISGALVERDWGMRDFRLRDPNGNQLGFGERLSPSST